MMSAVDKYASYIKEKLGDLGALKIDISQRSIEGYRPSEIVVDGMRFEISYACWGGFVGTKTGMNKSFLLMINGAIREKFDSFEEAVDCIRKYFNSGKLIREVKGENTMRITLREFREIFRQELTKVLKEYGLKHSLGPGFKSWDAMQQESQKKQECDEEGEEKEKEEEKEEEEKKKPEVLNVEEIKMIIKEEVEKYLKRTRNAKIKALKESKKVVPLKKKIVETKTVAKKPVAKKSLIEVRN